MAEEGIGETVIFCLRTFNRYQGSISPYKCEFFYKEGDYNYCSNKDYNSCDYTRIRKVCLSNKVVGCEESYQFDDRGNASTKNMSDFGYFGNSLWFCSSESWCKFQNRAYSIPKKKPLRMINL